MFLSFFVEGSGLRLEDYTFHPSVSCEDFEDSGKLSVISQLGEVGCTSRNS